MSVNSLRFDTIGNLPSNLCWTCNKSNNTYAKLEDGCIKISGTVCSTPGQYKLKFVATMDIGVPIVTDLDLLGLKYYLRIKNNGDADVLVDTGQTTPFVAYGPATNCVLCPCTLSQSSYTCPNSNANNYGNIVNVTAASGCIWATSVTSGGSWLSTTSSGNGNGSISISVLANNTGAARTGTIDGNGQILTVTQPALSTGIDDVSKIDFSVYPNPTHGKIYLNCNNSKNCNRYQMRLVNNLGQQLITQPLTGANTVINVTNCPKGVYIMQMLNEQNEIVGVKQIVLE